jgi:hypothetical protein
VGTHGIGLRWEKRRLTRASNFSLKALYAALDAQRQARGLSWSEATREMNRQSGRFSSRGLSASTVTGTSSRRAAEGDGVLQMLRWLNRTPESFVPGDEESEDVGAGLPAIPAKQILRFDTKRLHAALDGQRLERKLTWAQVAMDVGLSVSSLTCLSKGGRTGFPQVMRIVRWLGRPATHFMRASDR